MTSELQGWAGGVYDIGYRVVCCPKCRRLVVADGVAARDERLIRAKDRGHGWPIVALEIVLDHRHLFVKANWSDPPSRVANQFKGLTSRRPRAEFSHLPSGLLTLWSRSYFAATVGTMSAETVRRSIDTQNERPWWKGRRP